MMDSIMMSMVHVNSVNVAKISVLTYSLELRQQQFLYHPC